MRYFFHIGGGETEALDAEGAEFETFAEARNEAIASARQVVGDRLRLGLAPSHVQVRIADEDGMTLEVVPFAELVKAA